MKIVGRTDDGYIAQVSDVEIGIITGFGCHPYYGDNREKFLAATGRDTQLEKRNVIPTDTVINVVGAFDYISTLSEKQDQVEICANTLRQIADLITRGLPRVIVPPQEKESAK